MKEEPMPRAPSSAARFSAESSSSRPKKSSFRKAASAPMVPKRRTLPLPKGPPRDNVARIRCLFKNIMGFSKQMPEIPPTVRKPSRYSGAEVRRPLLPWEEARVRVLLAFPDAYEIGMSHLGIRLLYEILNARAGTRCERVFSPWPDYEEHLRAAGTPLPSLE